MTNSSSRAGSLVAGAVLIGLGVLFLLGQFLRFDAWDFVWPLAVVAFGALFFAGMVAGGRASGGLAIPGAIISAIGLLLLYQSLTGHYESWAYGWTVIVMGAGAGLFIMGWWMGDDSRRRSGLRVLAVGFVLFVIFGAFFELGASFFGSRGLRQLIFPILLIGVGLFLLVQRSGLLAGRAPLAAPSGPSETPGPAPAGEAAPPPADQTPGPQ